jgi:hypothetical protein
MKKLFFLLAGYAILAACQHERLEGISLPDKYDKYTVIDTLPPFQDISCQCFTSCDNFYDTLPYYFSAVCFNPKNPYQIAYLRSPINSFGLKNDIWVFDFETGKGKIIGTNAAYGLSWSSKDWLAFTGLDRQIYKIKTNGDSLTRLTNRNAYCNDPEWNVTGDKIAFQTDVTGYYHIIDEQGVQQDSIPILNSPLPPHRWIDTNTLLVSYLDGEVALMDMVTKTKKTIRTPPTNTSQTAKLFGYSAKRQQIYWMGKDGVRKTNVLTGESSIIQPYQMNASKYIGNYTDQTEKLIAVRYVIDFFRSDSITNPSPCWRRKYEYLSIMNPDATHERKILLPR